MVFSQCKLDQQTFKNPRYWLRLSFQKSRISGSNKAIKTSLTNPMDMARSAIANTPIPNICKKFEVALQLESILLFDVINNMGECISKCAKAVSSCWKPKPMSKEEEDSTRSKQVTSASHSSASERRTLETLEEEKDMKESPRSTESKGQPHNKDSHFNKAYHNAFQAILAERHLKKQSRTK